MFERFTRAARDAVVAARAVARETGAGSIGTPHLLVGAAADVPGLAPQPLRSALQAGSDAAALAALGIDLEEVRRHAEATFGPDALTRVRERRRRGRLGGDAMPFTPAAKRALEGALREAMERGDREISAGHVVLGVLRAQDPAALMVLRHAGLEPERVRALAEAARRRD